MLFRSKRFLYSILALTVVKSPLFPLLTKRQQKSTRNSFYPEQLRAFFHIILVVVYCIVLTTAFNIY